MNFKFRHTKPLADVLTVSRVLLSISLAVLGATQGAGALPVAVLIVILCWFTDLVDGPLARHDADSRTTWVGKHDAEADLLITVGVSAYLVFSGYLAVWVGVALMLVAVGLRILHSRALAWPVGAVSYLVLGIVTFQESPILGWVVVGYLLVTLAVRWPRLLHEFLPEFFDAVGSLFKGRQSYS